jgi:hypothetical protein
MIIGINGKIGSGKDTIGKIIQYLTYPHDINIQTYLEKEVNGQFEIKPSVHTIPNFEIKKFAGKLKQIASLLTGVSVEKFEDQDFKQKHMGFQWQMTYREFLQKLGTDALRDGLHTDVWVNALFADYKPESTGYRYLYPQWIITDMRFPNELEAVEERDGITIRVVRNPIIVITLDGEKLTLDYNEWLEQKQFYENQGWQFTEHPSETALDDAKFDYEIINDGTIEDLVEKVREILIKEEII